MRHLIVATMLSVLAYAVAVGQDRCRGGGLEQSAARVQAIESSLRKTNDKAGDDKADWSTDVTPPVSTGMQALKEALGQFSDLVMTYEPASVEATELQSRLATMLHANAPEPPEGTAISADDHRYDEILGSYGHNLRVQVRRPKEIQGAIEFRYSMNIECGADTMLLVYQAGRGEMRAARPDGKDGDGKRSGDGGWVRQLRWQSPPLHSISDAFGDFFGVAYLDDLPKLAGKRSWGVVVAHGTPWCTSRFSSFKIDLLSPGGPTGAAKQLWSTVRSYSRSDFAPVLKGQGEIFELRLNDDAMHFDEAGFERRVIYRYRVNAGGRPTRINPIASNARGFVEEWLTAPWDEARGLSAPEATAMLERVHASLMPPRAEDRYVRIADGPVRACSSPEKFQVQINASEEWLTSKRKPQTLPSRYFRLRQEQDGYVVLGAPDWPAEDCSGDNLMAPTK